MKTIRKYGERYRTVGRRIRHNCREKKVIENRAKNNVLDMAEQLPVKQQQQIVSSILKKNITQEKNQELEITTGGSKLKVIFRPVVKKSLVFSKESLNNFAVRMGMSGRQMKKTRNFIQSHAGRNAIPSYQERTRSHQSKILSEYYETEKLLFDVEKPVVKEKRPVVFAKSSEVSSAVIERRKLIGNYLVKVMTDCGTGSFKISFSIISEDCSDDMQLDNVNDSDLDDICIPSKKKKSDIR